MGYLGVTVVVAALVVVVTLGSFGQLAKIQVRAPWLLLAGLAVQIVVTFVGIPEHLFDSVGFGLIMASYVPILAFCFLNIGLRGIGIITIGIAMNALVIGLNQGMPTRDQPITTASGRHIRKPVEADVKHRAERDSDLLPFLGDIIWLPAPFDDEAISFGDLVLAVGICELAYFASRRRYTRGKAPEETAEGAAAPPSEAPTEPPSEPPSEPAVEPAPGPVVKVGAAAVPAPAPAPAPAAETPPTVSVPGEVAAPEPSPGGGTAGSPPERAAPAGIAPPAPARPMGEGSVPPPPGTPAVAPPPAPASPTGEASAPAPDHDATMELMIDGPVRAGQPGPGPPAQRRGTRAPRLSSTRSRAPSTRPS